MKENHKTFSKPTSETNHLNFFDSPYVKCSSNLLPNDDSEAQNDQDSVDEYPHVDGTESSDDTSLDSGATHNEDGTESLNSESGATLDELVTTFPIDHNTVESSSTSEGNGFNIPNVVHEPITQRRSNRTSKLPS